MDPNILRLAMGGAGAGGIAGDKIYSWGRNNEGQLGLGTSGAGTSVSSPNQIGSLSEWYDVGTALYSSFAIKGDNTLWSWGQNNYGQLGSGTTTNRSSPAQVGSLTNWSKISFGAYHCLSIKTDGTLWVWGGGFYNYGQLGLGDTTNRSSPTQVGALTDWLVVAGGNYFSAGVRSNGTLWSWGRNFSGQLGLGNTTDYSSPVQVGSLTNWLSVSAAKGGRHCLAIKTDGTLWSWGLNTSGQLGVGDTTDRSSPVQVGSLTTWAIVVAGSYSSFAIKTDGTLWAWGANSSGQLGLGDTSPKSSPIQIGSLATWTKVSCLFQHALALSD